MDTITDPQQLETITNLVHDHWFDVAAITFDSATSELNIPFGVRSRKRDLENIVPTGELCVHDALAYQVDDRADIGYYDINEICYSADSQTVHVTSSFPLQISVHVRGLWITVSDSAA